MRNVTNSEFGINSIFHIPREAPDEGKSAVRIPKSKREEIQMKKDAIKLLSGRKNLTCTILLVLALFAFLTAPVSAKDTSFVSKSFKEKTVTAPNGAVTVKDALTVNKLMGAHKKVVDEITNGAYHIRGWGIAHTIAIDAPEGFIIVDTGDSTKTAADMRKRLEERVGKKSRSLPSFIPIATTPTVQMHGWMKAQRSGPTNIWISINGQATV